MRNLLALLFCGILVSCGPRYELFTDYIAPNDEYGQQCVSEALGRKKSCDAQCNLQLTTCTNNARAIGQRNYDKALYLYNDKMSAYNAKLEIYNRQQPLRRTIQTYERECKVNKKYCHEYKENLLALNTLEVKPYYPSKPYLNPYINRASAHCSRDCGCTSQYDVSFQSCGGKVIRSNMCVDRCNQ